MEKLINQEIGEMKDIPNYPDYKVHPEKGIYSYI